MNALINRLFRQLFCRGGYGVHSPFVFDLITTVIEEQKHYYCYEHLHTVRLQLLQYQPKVTVRNRTMSVEKAINTCCFTEAEDRLLFRLANRFQPKTIFMVGSHFGLTPLYLTAYSKDSACIVFEPEPSIAAITDEFLKKYASASITLCDNMSGFFKTCNKGSCDGDNCLQSIDRHFDFIVWGNSFRSFDETLSLKNFERFLPHLDDKSVMVITGINASSNSRKVWKAICAHPKVTVTLDFYRFGIVIFNPQYPQKTYKSVVL